MNTPIKRLFICATSVMALASCGGGNDVASGGAGTGVTSASAVTASAPNGAAANSATSTSVTSTKAAMDRVGNIPSNCPQSPIPFCQNLSCLPNPAAIIPTSTASGTIYSKTNPLPYAAGTASYDVLNWSPNYTDLLISNYVAGALLGRLINETYPNVVFNKDYIYGSLFAQLLNENVGTFTPGYNYDNSTNWINPSITRPTVMGTYSLTAGACAPGTGGPYQINNYGLRESYYDPGPPIAGLGLVNYIGLQQGMGYTVKLQDANAPINPNPFYSYLTPDSLDSKYFGPLAAAYFSFNDIYAAKQGTQPNGLFNTCLNNLNQANITAQSANNILDVVLSTFYNSGFCATCGPGMPLTTLQICAAISPSPSSTQLTALQALVNYNLNPTQFSAATGVSATTMVQYMDYARDVRFSLDQLYNNSANLPQSLAPSAPGQPRPGSNSVNLSIQDIATVFANVFGTLSYVNSAGKYGYIANADGAKAFAAALATSGLSSTLSLNISNATDRATFFTLLDTAIKNLETSLINNNFTGFNAITQADLQGVTVSSPQVNPAIAK
ncbi:hypothetical protein MCEZE4_01428 [Burkholderiaceae bacterium]